MLRRFLPFLLVWPPILLAQEGDEALDVDYAQAQPLATQSLLLDITRTESGRLVAVGERGHVVLSDDGENWRQADVVPTRSTLTSVAASGGRLWAAGHDTVIITSGDNGETWTREYFDPERQQAVMDLHFVDERNGVAMGAYGLYLTTDDGGEYWYDGVVDEENEFHLNDLVRFTDGRRIIAGEAGYSYRSFDDGETWEPLDLPYLGSMWGATAVGEGCVLFFGLRGHMLESCDFGDNWEELSAGTLSSLSGATHADGTTIVVGNSGAVLVREAGGRFSVDVHSSGVDFASVLALGGGRFVLVGEDGIHQYPEVKAKPESAQGGSGQ
ncbi:MAG: YCF48-related protein [Xanthomonadales bacterium]|nr:YCF48-related protein [Xanthomonadales bacterium]